MKFTTAMLYILFVNVLAAILALITEVEFISALTYVWVLIIAIIVLDSKHGGEKR